MHSEGERATARILSEVPSAQSPGVGGVRRASHSSSHKVLRAGPLHSHLVRERPKTVPELSDQFTKFSKLEIQHFYKLEQRWKAIKPDEASRARYSDNHRNYTKLVHNISSDSSGALENWNKSYREPPHNTDSGTLHQRPPQSNQ
jgi:hypothetical protein